MTISPPRLGLTQNWKQFTLLILVNAFVGAMVGLERTIVPILADEVFGIQSRTIILSFLISFGVVKAITNLFAGRLGDVNGRQRILVAGWLIGLPIPFILIFAPTWGWIIFANVLLGINQGLCWSTTVIMKIDLVGPKQRGLAMGLNEFAGYLAVSLSAFYSGHLAATLGIRPFPFYPGILFAIFGLLFSIFFVKETKQFAQIEATMTATSAEPLPFKEIFWLTSWKNKTLFSVSQAGMVNNLNDGMIWGLLPLFLTGQAVPLSRIAILAALYPGVWGISQLFTGALSDKVGRKWLIVGGMVMQAVGIGVIVIGPHAFAGASRLFSTWAVAVSLLGLGTAMVYPTLLAAISDVAHPEWRGSAVGVYRLWRDLGYAIGALLSGLIADALGIPAAIGTIGFLTLLSGIIVAAVMQETLPTKQSDSKAKSYSQ